jgi:hypothetical protein
MSCNCSSESRQSKVDYQYAAKIVCGLIKPKNEKVPASDLSLPPGEYFTKVNVHNPDRCDCVTFRWKVAVAGKRGKPGYVSDFIDVTICADQAVEFVNSDILARIPLDRKHEPAEPIEAREDPKLDPDLIEPYLQGLRHMEGWLVIESPVELDVVSVYGTTSAKDGSVNAFHTERVQARCMTPCEDFHLDISTGVSAWKVSAPPVGPGGPNNSFNEAYLGAIDTNWPNLPGSLWIHPSSSRIEPAGLYVYALDFDLCSGFRNPMIKGSLLADYYANVFLNGVLISTPPQTTGPNFPNPVGFQSTSNFKVGNNSLRVEVFNLERGTTGLALNGSIEVESGRCPGKSYPLLCCPEVQYSAYLQRFPFEAESAGGWHGWARNGETIGTTGQNRRIEKIKVELIGCRPPGMTIQYRVRSAPIPGGAVWTSFVSEGQEVGVFDQRMEKIQVDLINAPLHCHLCYRVYMRGIEWGEWTQEGGQAGTESGNRRIEALEMKFC